jgi:hypothetical protein
MLVDADVLAGYEPRISDRFTRWVEDTRAAYRSAVLRGSTHSNAAKLDHPQLSD